MYTIHLGCLNQTYVVKDDEARDDMAAPDMADGQEADKDAHMAADVEADIEVVKAIAPEAEEEADPACEAEGHPAAEAERPSPFKPNPKDRLAGKLAMTSTLHTHSLLAAVDDFITCALCCH